MDKLKRYLKDQKQSQEDDNLLVQAVLEAEKEFAANTQASSSQEKVTKYSFFLLIFSLKRNEAAALSLVRQWSGFDSQSMLFLIIEQCLLF